MSVRPYGRCPPEGYPKEYDVIALVSWGYCRQCQEPTHEPNYWCPGIVELWSESKQQWVTCLCKFVPRGTEKVTVKFRVNKPWFCINWNYKVRIIDLHCNTVMLYPPESDKFVEPGREYTVDLLLPEPAQPGKVYVFLFQAEADGLFGTHPRSERLIPLYVIGYEPEEWKPPEEESPPSAIEKSSPIPLLAVAGVLGAVAVASIVGGRERD